MESGDNPQEQKHVLAVVEASPGFVDHWTCTACGWYFAFSSPRPISDVRGHDEAREAFHRAHSATSSFATCVD